MGNNISAHAVMPLNELQNRVRKVQDVLIANQSDACVISSSVNLFYLTGFIFDGFMFIAPEGEPVLFVKRPIDIKGNRIEYIRKPEQIGELLPKYGLGLPRRVYVESEVLSYSTTMRLQSALGMPEMLNISAILRTIRSVKSDHELTLIRESARLQSKVYTQIPSVFKPGMSDIDFQIEMEYLLRKEGSLGLFRSFGENMEIFMGSILAGDNAGAASPYDFSLGGKGVSSILPIGASGIKLTSGITLMVDMSGVFTPYQSDMTRTFAIGDVPEIAYKTHQLSLDIHKRIQDETKSGTSCAQLYNLAEEMVKEKNMDAYFMGTVQQAKFIGHGIGIEINEPPVLTPRSKETLQPNMVIAIEPKFVLPGIGGVGMENSYIVHESGLEKITICEESLVRL